MKLFNVLLVLLPFVMGAKKFFIPNIKANWYKGHEFCITLGMDMVSVHTRQDHDELVQFIERSDKFSNATRFWLGASDLAEEGVYTWVSSGRLVTFTNWAENEPNNSDDVEHCIEIIHNVYVNRVWQWNDIECRKFQAYFVCESGNKQCVEQF